MNLYLRKTEGQLLQAKFEHALKEKFAKIGEGVRREFVDVSSTKEGPCYTFEKRSVVLMYRTDEMYWLALKGPTGGITTVQFIGDDDDLDEAVTVFLNWMIHKTFSTVSI